ncbi:hypothetical protein [Adhaeribacter soli]|uniref:Uncharacterized protein n=1 Tax=Adhaeribacter soli TaxID=2607655 RepID=A0A5N1IN32_9BACT|nr:hypothetical protein [Adhaeribacter soli]KAA9331138.1 hypothetical protein F0P94_14680 [Adhaeribacter soli]
MEDFFHTYRKLMLIFKDKVAFVSNFKAAFLLYKNSNDSPDNDKYVSEEATYYTRYLDDFINSIQQKAGIPPFHTTLPLLYVADTNLKWLIIQSKLFLKECRENELIIRDIGVEAYTNVFSFWETYNHNSDGKEPQHDSNLAAAEELEVFLNDARFVSDILIPFLVSFIDVLEDRYQLFNSFYGLVIEELASDMAIGENAIFQMGNALLNISTEEELFAFINVNAQGDLIDQYAYTKNKPSVLNAEQLAILFAYLRKVGVITNPNDTELKRYVSLLTGVSHNTIYEKGLRHLQASKNNPSVLQKLNKKKKLVNVEAIEDVLASVKKKVRQDAEEHMLIYY